MSRESKGNKISFEKFLDELSAPFFAIKVVEIHKRKHLCQGCLKKLAEGYYDR